MLRHLTLKKLYEGTPSRLYEKGTVVCDTKNPTRGLYRIVTGNVNLTIISAGGKDCIVHTLGPNDQFPLVGYFLGDKRSELYTATTDVYVQWCGREEIDEFCALNPEVLREIIGVILETLICRVKTLSLGVSEQRVLLRIQELAKRFGEIAGEDVALMITQQELADSVNLSRESVCRILNALELQNIVKLQRKKLFIDIKKLDQALENTL